MGRDNYSEEMWILKKDDDLLVVEIRSDDEKSLLGSYWNAVQIYRDTGDLEPLIDFRGESVAGFELETNPAEIEYHARTGALDFKDIYAVTTNG